MGNAPYLTAFLIKWRFFLLSSTLDMRVWKLILPLARKSTERVFHISGGATRDVIPFQSEKGGSRTFEVTIDHLDSGE